MAQTVDLVTLAEARDFLDLGVSEMDDDSLIETFVTAASLEFQRLCRGRRFKAVAEERSYYSNSVRTLFWDHAEWENCLWLGDEICALTSFTNGDGNAISTDDLLLLPQNGPQYWWIFPLPDAGGIWAEMTSPIVVDAKYGFADWTTAPDEGVKLGVKRLVEVYYRTRGAGPVRTITLPNGVTIAVPAGVPADVMNMAQLYRQEC